MANQCVDNNFTVSEDGILGIKLLGDPDCEAWPFTADPADSNGLHCDPDGGLWVAPSKEILQVQHSLTHTPGTITGIGVIPGATMTANITNPSAEVPMLLVLTHSIEFRIGQGSGTSGTFSGLEVSLTQDNPALVFVEQMSNFRAQGVGSGILGWLDTWTAPRSYVLAAGATTTFRLTPRVRGYVGDQTQYNLTTARIDGFGITL